MMMKKNFFERYGAYVFLAVILVAVAAIVIAKNSTGNSPLPAPDITGGDAEVQVVNLGTSGFSYTPNPIIVQAGRPVKLVNSGLQGCSVYVVQQQLGINANFANNEEYIFTPKIKGTFTMACTMGMYKGTIQVI